MYQTPRWMRPEPAARYEDRVLLYDFPVNWSQVLKSRVSKRVRLESYSDPQTLSQALREDRSALAILRVSDVSAAQVAVDETVRLVQIAAGRPTAGIVLSSHELSPRGVLRLAKAGLREVFEIGREAELRELIRWIESERIGTLHSRVWQIARLDCSSEAQTLIKAGLRMSHAPYSVAQFADACGMSDRTLRRMCHHCGLGAPLRVVAFTRLMMASFLLDRGESAESVAAMLNFESPEGMFQKLAKWAKIRARQAPCGGYLTAVSLAMLKETVAPNVCPSGG